jgi:hypothetical protein
MNKALLSRKDGKADFLSVFEPILPGEQRNVTCAFFIHLRDIYIIACELIDKS